MRSFDSEKLKVRKPSYFMLTALVLVLAGPAAGQDEPMAIDHGRAAELFAEARAMSGANPWQGRLYGPMLFVEPESRYVVANEADAEGILQPVDGVFSGVLPEDKGIANTVISWGGRHWTMVIWPLPSGYFERRRLVAHELFHRLGPELGIPLESPSNAHLDTRVGRLWFRLELRALTRALASEGAERVRSVEDALAFRGRRHAAFPSGAEEERQLELNEGLAEYTGIRVSLPDGARAGWAVQRMESFDVRAETSGVTRNFAYATGPGYGLLLDAAMPGWQVAVRDSTDLGALLADAFNVNQSAVLSTELEGRMVPYDGAALSALEARREAVQFREQNEFRDRFVVGPVVNLPVDKDFGYSFNPNAVSALEGVGQVLATAKIRAGWGTLDVTGGVLLKRSDRGVTGVVVPAPRDPGAPPLAGDGWSLTLAEGWEVVPGERPGDWQVRRGG
jgi:hypothetical protein